MRIRSKSSIKGLRDIRTVSGKAGRAGVPYMVYMNISCLEMEKARREKEKFSAENTIRKIDSRLAEIKAQKESLLASLGERRRKVPECRDDKVTGEDCPKVHLAEDAQPFRIKY